MFDVEIAKKYGVNSAILLENIYFWITKNKSDKRHFHDGRYWTYSSSKSLEELLPYMGKKQLRYALDKLIDQGLLVTGNYNDNPFDRTLWYSLTDDGLKLFEGANQDGETRSEGDSRDSHFGKCTFSHFGKCSLYSTDNITDNNISSNEDIYRGADKPPAPPSSSGQKRFVPPTLEEVAAYCSERHNSVSPSAFIDYYEARGWKYGTGKPMVNWKAAVRTWEQKDKERTRTQGSQAGETAAEANARIFDELFGGKRL